jgi:PAS domain S-box-containing protein
MLGTMTGPTAEARAQAAYVGRPAWLGYGLAAILPGVTSALLLMWFDVHNQPFLAPLLASVIISAWFGGWKPGVLATTVSAAITARYFLAPVGSFTVADPEDLRRLATLVALSLLCCWLIHLMQRRTGDLAIAQDRHKQAAEMVTSLARFNQEVINSAPYGIVVFDREYKLLTWNPAQEKISGLLKEAVLGKSAIELFPFIDETGIRWAIERALAGQTIFISETPFWVEQSGRRGWVSLHFGPVRDSEGNVSGVLSSVREITEQKSAEDALRRNENLAATGRLAATLAHEINNPLASVNNILYLVGLERDLSKKAASLVDLARKELERVTHITRQTLGFYREATSPITFEPARIVEDVVSLYTRKLQQSGVHLQLETRPTHLDVRGYPHEIKQVVLNLVTNAADAMGGGGRLAVRVRAGSEWTPAGRAGVRILVADTGHGIAPEHRKRVAEPFFTTKGEKGTGLGLWVSKSIVAKHQGTMRVHSSQRPGRSGTCFWVFLPAEPVAVSAPAADRSHKVAG